MLSIETAIPACAVQYNPRIITCAAGSGKWNLLTSNRSSEHMNNAAPMAAVQLLQWAFGRVHRAAARQNMEPMTMVYSRKTMTNGPSAMGNAMKWKHAMATTDVSPASRHAGGLKPNANTYTRWARPKAPTPGKKYSLYTKHPSPTAESTNPSWSRRLYPVLLVLWRSSMMMRHVTGMHFSTTCINLVGGNIGTTSDRAYSPTESRNGISWSTTWTWEYK